MYVRKMSLGDISNNQSLLDGQCYKQCFYKTKYTTNTWKISKNPRLILTQNVIEV